MSGDRLLSLSIQAYRMLLQVYPAEHRRQYGALMLQAFGDLCRDAYHHSSAWGLVQLWGRTLLDVLATAVIEHWEMLRKRGAMDVENRSFQAVSWSQIALAALLGAYSIALSLLVGPTTSHWPAIVGLGLWGTLAVIGLIRRVPSWSLPALGILLLLPGVPLVFVGPWLWIGYPIVVMILLGKSIRIPWAAWVLPLLILALGCIDLALGRVAANGISSSGSALASSAIALTPVLVGLPFARRHGLRAVLAVVTAESIVYAFMGDPDYAMALYPQGWIVSLALSAPMLICPIWVLSTRSVRWQKRGILWPWAGMLVISVIVPGLLRSHAYSWSLWLRHICVAGEFFLAVLLAVSLYSRAQSVAKSGVVAGVSAGPVEPAGCGSTPSTGAAQC
jgi:hypothetical protein